MASDMAAVGIVVAFLLGWGFWLAWIFGAVAVAVGLVAQEKRSQAGVPPGLARIGLRVHHHGLHTCDLAANDGPITIARGTTRPPGATEPPSSAYNPTTVIPDAI